MYYIISYALKFFENFTAKNRKDEDVIAKILEVRDRATFITVVAIQLTPDEFLVRYAGWSRESSPSEMVLVCKLVDGVSKSTTDPYDWADRTMKNAHHYIAKNFSSLASGDVVDVEFVLGEVPSPKISERFSSTRASQVAQDT